MATVFCALSCAIVHCRASSLLLARSPSLCRVAFVRGGGGIVVVFVRAVFGVVIVIESARRVVVVVNRCRHAREKFPPHTTQPPEERSQPGLNTGVPPRPPTHTRENPYPLSRVWFFADTDMGGPRQPETYPGQSLSTPGAHALATSQKTMDILSEGHLVMIGDDW